ncbi:unnamed protein product [Gadus morhua 'NCC']
MGAGRLEEAVCVVVRGRDVVVGPASGLSPRQQGLWRVCGAPAPVAGSGPRQAEGPAPQNPCVSMSSEAATWVGVSAAQICPFGASNERKQREGGVRSREGPGLQGAGPPGLSVR